LEEVDDVLDLAAMLLLLALRAADPIQHAGDEVVAHEMVAADHDVVEHRHVAEQGEVLKRAADPEAGAGGDGAGGRRPALVAQPARAGAIAAGDAVEHRGLAGPVGPDDGEDLALLHLEADVAQRAHTAEADRYVRHLEDGRAQAPRSGDRPRPAAAITR